jgi:asparagine synthetase B (glutamine-hydrolysing)
MVEDTPVGEFPSGGMDSSTVMALAHEMNSEIRCFMIDGLLWYVKL